MLKLLLKGRDKVHVMVKRLLATSRNIFIKAQWLTNKNQIDMLQFNNSFNPKVSSIGYMRSVEAQSHTVAQLCGHLPSIVLCS